MSGQLLQKHEDRLRDRIAELGLGDFASGILSGSYSGYLLVGDSQALTEQAGTTRFGGDPDVPEAFDTAALDDLVFIFQVNMSDLPQAQALGLPEAGLLSVFSHREPYDGGKTFYFEPAGLVRHRMAAPDPDYVFSDMKPWKLKIKMSVDFPEYGDDLFDEIVDAGLESEYEQLSEMTFDDVSGPPFGQLLGRFSDLNGDMREDAADENGGEVHEWISLWKVFSNRESGLVISDFFLLHGMIRRPHLRELNFRQMYSCMSNG